MKLEIVLDRDEINNSIAYSMICMTRYGSTWNTMRRKRRWTEEFTESERAKASKLFQQSHNWTCVTGVPDTIRMAPSTYDLWQKLAAFCCSL